MAAQSFELDMDQLTKIPPTTSSSPSPRPSNDDILSENTTGSSKKNASLDASLQAPTTANATVRTRRNNANSTTNGKSSVFQLVKSKATTSSLATSNMVTNNVNTNNTGSQQSSNNVFDETNGFEAVDFQQDLEKTLPKIDLNRNMDLFGQSSSNNSVVNRKDINSIGEESPIIKNDGKTKFANTRLGRFIRRLINHVRVWSKSPFIKYTFLVLLVLSLVVLIGMFIIPLIKGNANTEQVTTNNAPSLETEKAPSDSLSWWGSFKGLFGSSSKTSEPLIESPTTSNDRGTTAELVLTLPFEKYKEGLENYFTQSKPIVLKKYSNKWISSSTWKKEFTPYSEFKRKLNKMKNQVAKFMKRKGLAITLVNLDKPSKSVHRVPFTENLKEHEFEYDFPTRLEHFTTLKTVFSEIWVAIPSKRELIKIGKKENNYKFTICMLADTSSQSQMVQLTSPAGEETDTDIKTNDCIYIPSGWGFNFNVKVATKFIAWVYE